MTSLDVLYLVLLPSGLIPIYLMLQNGKKLPSKRGDKKDRNPVNRHLRFFDACVRAKVGRKGIFITEIYSTIAHALMPVGVLPFLKLSSFAGESDPCMVQSGVVAVLLVMLACAGYYFSVAWRRYCRAK